MTKAVWPALAVMAAAATAPAQTELHLQYGELLNPFSATGEQTVALTVIDDNAGLAGGGPPATGHSWMLDVSWALPFEAGGQSLAIAGHAEYVGGSTDELDREVRGWILAQPQFTWDLGRALLGRPHRLLAGIEYQYWRNKLGTDQLESTAQLLLVWRP